MTAFDLYYLYCLEFRPYLDVPENIAISLSQYVSMKSCTLTMCSIMHHMTGIELILAKTTTWFVLDLCAHNINCNLGVQIYAITCC